MQLNQVQGSVSLAFVGLFLERTKPLLDLHLSQRGRSFELTERGAIITRECTCPGGVEVWPEVPPMNVLVQVTGLKRGTTRYPRYDAAALGFANYWYPVMTSRQLRERKPKPLTLFGERI